MKYKSLLVTMTMLVLFLVGCGSSSFGDTRPVDKTYTLKTSIVQGKMSFVGVGGEIDAIVNPDLTAAPGDTIRIVLTNKDGIPHDFSIPQMKVHSSLLSGKEKSTEMVFTVNKDGNFPFYCTVAGHREAGMEGKLVVIE